MANPKTWDGLCFKKDEVQHNRIRWAPYGDTDFIDLPAPISTVMAGPLGVNVQCWDGGIYLIRNESRGYVGDANNWRVILICKY